MRVRNELEMDAPPDAVWAWLIRAQRWPEWYQNSADVSIQPGASPAGIQPAASPAGIQPGASTDLGPATAFTWKTFGVRLESTVIEFVPGERIAWNALGAGVDAYHAWLLRPTPRGTHVVTEETQYGWLARLSAMLQPERMSKGHQTWLEGLRDRARSGHPPR